MGRSQLVPITHFRGATTSTAMLQLVEVEFFEEIVQYREINYLFSRAQGEY